MCRVSSANRFLSPIPFGSGVASRPGSSCWIAAAPFATPGRRSGVSVCALQHRVIYKPQSGQSCHPPVPTERITEAENRVRDEPGDRRERPVETTRGGLSRIDRSRPLIKKNGRRVLAFLAGGRSRPLIKKAACLGFPRRWSIAPKHLDPSIGGSIERGTHPHEDGPRASSRCGFIHP